MYELFSPRDHRPAGGVQRSQQCPLHKEQAEQPISGFGCLRITGPQKRGVGEEF